MRRTPPWEAALLVSLFALVGVSVTLGLFYIPRLLLEDAPTRVAAVAQAWLPSRLLAGALALVGLSFVAGTLAMSVHVLWLLLHPGRLDAGERRSFVWYQLRLRGAESYTKALLEDVARAGSTAIGAGLLAGLSYLLGSSERLELDLATWRYRRATEYLGVLTVSARELPASDVLGATVDETETTDADGYPIQEWHVSVHLADASADRLEGSEEVCRAAAAAFQRLLAERARVEPEAERSAPR